MRLLLRRMVSTMARPKETMLKFEKENFSKTIHLIALRAENKLLGKMIQRLHGNLLNMPKLKNVVADEKEPSSEKKLILLSEKVQSLDLSPLPSDLVEFLISEGAEPVNYSMNLDYDHWTMEHVLKEILPPNTEIPSAFETIGHIAHLNLRESQLPYKHIIGNVLLDKNVRIKTVVNKTSSIATEFRTFPMEIIAGVDDMEVELKECKALFRFNYSQVYWNSRLQKEHERIILQMQPTDILCDMMCGVGPFAIPIAMKGCTVYANDLNPNSVRYLKTNAQLNKVKIFDYNLDARDFVNHLFQEKKQFTHVVMNLPAIALEFLDVFPGKFDHWNGPLPFIHCYCFSNAQDPKQDVLERTESIIGTKLDESTTKIHIVRDVSPNKLMICISFQMPETAAYSSSSSEVNSKRRKLNDSSKA